MRRVVVGHRGVGKSTFLKRHQLYYNTIPHFDLDIEIEKHENKLVADIFQQNGEDYFRKIENKIFHEITQQHEAFCLACGGGFEVQNIEKATRAKIEIVYLSRRTDADGRLFLNRPRLNSQMSALDEYKFRFKQRDENFRKHCDWIYHLPEGLDVVSVLERDFWGQEFVSAYYTLTLKTEFLYFNYHRNFEIRTDDFSLNEILQIVNERKDKNFLISIRHEENNFEKLYNFIFQLKHFENVKIDLALEQKEQSEKIIKLFYEMIAEQQANATSHEYDTRVAISHGSQEYIQNAPFFHTWVISTHKADLNKAIEELSTFENKFSNLNDKIKLHFKLCPVVSNWSELEQGFNWQRQQKYKRNFLPRTDFSKYSKSQWRWLRILLLNMQSINFVQTRKDNDDQPSYFEFLMQKMSQQYLGSEKLFGAVLGDPIHHSRSPLLQFDFFEQRLNFLAIPLTEFNFDQGIAFLKRIGLKWAAVTSPLKNKAAQLSQTFDSQMNKIELESANTLYFASDNKSENKSESKSENNAMITTNNTTYGFSTDEIGFQYLLRKLEHKLNKPLSEFTFVLWGGGGVVPALKLANIQFTEYSSRLAQPKNNQAEVKNPDVVIWAAPRLNETLMPPPRWNPQVVLDLNYSDHSMGLEYAQSVANVVYISGLKMLIEQGREQFKICKALLKKEGLL